jgi:phosphoribosylformylglycinamidine cyclo-ligase
MFRPDLSGFKRPVLLSSTDSVGTKLKLAFMTGIHNTVGEDLVNHCINDILVHGARALFFLDYIATPKVDPEHISQIVDGIARGCRNAGVALVGGETAELPDFYSPNEYDLVGFVVGVVDQDRIINGSTIRSGDVCLGFASSGLHTNGYTLARKVAFEVGGLRANDRVEQVGTTIAESLMAVHRCYAPLVHNLIDAGVDIHGMAHITGGGIPGNLKRILPGNMSAEIKLGSWPVLPLFEFLRVTGDIDDDDIYSAFNMGIGYILVAPPEEVDHITSVCSEQGETAYRIGEIAEGDGLVHLNH